jgi:hypothetical protein
MVSKSLWEHGFSAQVVTVIVDLADLSFSDSLVLSVGNYWQPPKSAGGGHSGFGYDKIPFWCDPAAGSLGFGSAVGFEHGYGPLLVCGLQKCVA